MNRVELIRDAANRSGQSQANVGAALNALLDSISDELVKGGSVQLIGFGTFEVRHRNARTGRNPQTGETIEVAASTVPAFKAGAKLKSAVKG